MKVGEYYIGTCRGKEARYRVSTNPDSNLFTGNIPQKHPSPSKYVGYPLGVPQLKYYARSNLWFESGESG
jgi:hypothetical protein